MKAAVMHEQGDPDVLSYEEIDDPTCDADGVIVDVEVIAIEGGDVLNRRMLPGKQFPHVVGYQAAGRISQIGQNVTRLSVGQRVAAFAFAGSHAERFAVPAATAFPIPDSLDARLAATIPVCFGTAGWALFDHCALRWGETVFVFGGSGGVGLAAIQLARSAGAMVIATARGDAHGTLRDLGCDHVIDYTQVDFSEEIARITDGKGAHVVLDMVGGNPDAVAKLCSTVAARGRLAAVGLASGVAPSYPFFDIAPRGLAVHGVLFGNEMHTTRARVMLEDQIARAAAGKLSMPVAKVFPLSQAAEAHRFVEEMHPVGRVLMTP